MTDAATVDATAASTVARAGAAGRKATALALRATARGVWLTTFRPVGSVRRACDSESRLSWW